MAKKGFKVKTVEPKPKQAVEFDYDKIKQKMRGKTIVFCLPGRSCSYTFLKSFVSLCFEMVQNGMSIQISQDYSSMVNFSRCKVLGYNVTRGKHQKPWGGQLEYDYQLWIDNDIVFNPQQFWQLCDSAIFDEPLADTATVEEWPLCKLSTQELESMDEWDIDVRKEKIRRMNLEGYPIVSGWYVTEDRNTTPVAHWIDDGEEFIRNGGTMKHETVETMARRSKVFSASFVGGGWLLIRKGVFEKMEYPVWGPKLQSFDNGITDYCGEDVGFCLDAKELGFQVAVDPRIRVGHEKNQVI